LLFLIRESLRWEIDIRHDLDVVCSIILMLRDEMKNVE